MKVKLHRTLGTGLMTKLGVADAKQRLCVEGAIVALPDDVGQKLVESKLADIAEIAGTPKPVNQPPRAASQPKSTTTPATGSAATTTTKPDVKGS